MKILNGLSNGLSEKLGLIGFGVVNQAVYKNIKEDQKKNIFIQSLEPKYKKTRYNYRKVYKTKANIICIPTDHKTSPEESLKGIIKILHDHSIKRYKGIIIIKSTLLPSKLKKIIKDNFKDNFYNKLRIVYWPEFLNALTAAEDFKEEIPLFGGDPIDIEDTVLILKKFLDKDLSNYNVGTDEEVMEYKFFRNISLMNHFLMVNTIPSLFSTNIRKFDKLQKSYEYNFNNLKISPDGHTGIGGACLPKDLDNFIQYKKDFGDNPSLTFLKNNATFNNALRS